eukprot:11259847-Alexandrium_andersonii.AAC.1
MTGWRTVECAREGKRARPRGRPRRARRASPPAEPPQRGRGARTTGGDGVRPPTAWRPAAARGTWKTESGHRPRGAPPQPATHG